MPRWSNAIDHTAVAEASPAGPAPLAPPAAITPLAFGAIAGACVLPALAIARSPVRAAPYQCAVATAIALVVFAVISLAPRSVVLAALGVLGAGTACWLLAQASYPVGAWLIAPALGVGAGLAAPARPRTRADAARAIGAAVIVAACLVALRAAFGRDAALATGAAGVAAVAAVGAFGSRRPSAATLRTVAALAVPAILLPVLTAAYIGSTTPRVTWFGALTSHGPRNGNEVALTFDDGPNGDYTRQVAQILDAHGAKGTFFTVGKALNAQPEVSRSLLDDGQLLGDHSYNHDAVGWLDPRYPQLQQTQDAFQRQLGLCPAFYRPPHGSHTPFMSHILSEHGMTMVTWDDSAGDWATDDPQLVAKRILDGVRPGSIILLHDGIDGIPGADRTVVLKALPLILDGLRSRGLQPVTLDKLLGKPGYVPC